MVKLEAGKYYKTRDGRKVGPMVYDGHDTYPWSDNSVSPGIPCWTNDGRLISICSPDIVSEWYSSCAAAQVDVQREEYGPIRTRREIKPGEYGKVIVSSPEEGYLDIHIVKQGFNAESLREAAHLFNQLAEVLDERA